VKHSLRCAPELVPLALFLRKFSRALRMAEPLVSCLSSRGDSHQTATRENCSRFVDLWVLFRPSHRSVPKQVPISSAQMLRTHFDGAGNRRHRRSRSVITQFPNCPDDSLGRRIHSDTMGPPSPLHRFFATDTRRRRGLCQITPKFSVAPYSPPIRPESLPRFLPKPTTAKSKFNWISLEIEYLSIEEAFKEEARNGRKNR
jgi:hypothetical protein